MLMSDDPRKLQACKLGKEVRTEMEQTTSTKNRGCFIAVTRVRDCRILVPICHYMVKDRSVMLDAISAGD
jgi:hypothetical protein